MFISDHCSPNPQTTRQAQRCGTSSIALTKLPIKNYSEVEQYIKELKEKVKRLGLDEYYGWYLGTTYGTQSDEILQLTDKYAAHTPEAALACAEVLYGIHREFVVSASDFFVRRTGRIFFDINSIPQIREHVMRILQVELRWTDDRLTQENHILDSLLKDASSYYSKEK